jgi:hypothetical protein
VRGHGAAEDPEQEAGSDEDQLDDGNVLEQHRVEERYAQVAGHRRGQQRHLAQHPDGEGGRAAERRDGKRM